MIRMLLYLRSFTEFQGECRCSRNNYCASKVWLPPITAHLNENAFHVYTSKVHFYIPAGKCASHGFKELWRNFKRLPSLSYASNFEFLAAFSSSSSFKIKFIFNLNDTKLLSIFIFIHFNKVFIAPPVFDNSSKF